MALKLVNKHPKLLYNVRIRSDAERVNAQKHWIFKNSAPVYAAAKRALEAPKNSNKPKTKRRIEVRPSSQRSEQDELAALNNAYHVARESLLVA